MAQNSATTSIFPSLPKPKSMLGYHRVLSPTAGARVSPLCLGAMSFGDEWKEFLGECNKKTTFEILDHFYQSGGNFIDTANNYQREESETWIGDWMKERGNRDEIVLATKYTTLWPRDAQNGKAIKDRGMITANYGGNHSKSLRLSLDASLKKLQTDYIDLFYVHWWDFTTSIPEVMQALHHLVVAGKVLYLGISDTPAWIVSKSNEYARQKGLTQFSVYQGLWSASTRDFERDILPMCEAEGMAIAPWGAIGRGSFRPAADYAKEKTEGRIRPVSDKEKQVSAALEKVANEKKTLITSVALAYVMHKYPYVYPIVGGRNTKHLQGNIEALGVDLTDEEVAGIDAAVPFDVGFPMNMLFGGEYSTRKTSKDIGLVQNASVLDDVEKPRRPPVHKD